MIKKVFLGWKQNIARILQNGIIMIKKVYLGWKFRNSESTSWVKKLNIRKNSWKCKEESKSWVKTKYKQEFKKYTLEKKQNMARILENGKVKKKIHLGWKKYKQELLKMG